jgi:hypothetical protein
VGVPVSDATQWDQIERVADCAYPVFEQLKTLAAQGEVIYQDGRCFKAVDLIFSLSGCDIHMTEGHDDYSSAPLPLLPRNRHRPTWQIA